MINFSKPKHLFYFLLTVLSLPVIYLIVEIIAGKEVISTYGANKTIGWAWDFCPLLPFFAIISLFIATICYALLMLFKLTLNKWISILHLITLAVVLAFLWVSPYDYEWCYLRLKLTILSGGFLFANILFAIAYKLYHKTKD